MDLSDIYLPADAVIVLQDKAEEKRIGNLILPTEESKPNSGVIVASGHSFKTHIGETAIFRENFAEKITIENIEYLYFRNFEASIFYLK